MTRAFRSYNDINLLLSQISGQENPLDRSIVFAFLRVIFIHLLKLRESFSAVSLNIRVSILRIAHF